MPLLPGGRALALERRTAWLPGVLSGRIVGDAQTITTFSIESFFRFFHAAPQPPSPARGCGSLHVKFRARYTTLLVTTAYLLFTVYCLLFITATPLRRLRYAVTRAPLSRCLRGGSGRLGTGPGRMRQSKLTIVHACAHQWLVRQWSLLHGLARAGPHWVPGGQELYQAKAMKCSKRRLR